MALTDDQIEEKKARNEANRDKILTLKQEIAQAEADANNDIRGEKLDKENAAQEAEIARLEAIAESINAGSAPAAKPVNKPVTGDQRTPTNFGGNAATEVKE